MTSGTRQVVAALLALAVTACGSGNGKIPVGTYESTINGTRSELDGAWALSIEPQGRFRIALNGQPAVTGNYRYDGEKVTFTDESGPMMCAAGVTSGSYTWTVADSELTLIVASDECPGRRGILNRQLHRPKPGA